MSLFLVLIKLVDNPYEIFATNEKIKRNFRYKLLTKGIENQGY